MQSMQPGPLHFRPQYLHWCSLQLNEGTDSVTQQTVSAAPVPEACKGGFSFQFCSISRQVPAIRGSCLPEMLQNQPYAQLRTCAAQFACASDIKKGSEHYMRGEHASIVSSTASHRHDLER